jgi:type IV pilus assembly protein PilV
MHLSVHRSPRPRGEQGFTLVEVLVTVFVIAVGLLAAAALQTVSKKAAIDAMQRTTATVLAQDMAERIRSNPLRVNDYIGKTVAPGETSINAPACGAATGAACANEQVAALDLAQWWGAMNGAAERIGTENAGGLRSPRGCIRNGTSSQWVEIIIEWRGLSAINQTADGSNADDPLAAQCGTPLADYETTGTGVDTVSFRRVLRLQTHIARVLP